MSICFPQCLCNWKNGSLKERTYLFVQRIGQEQTKKGLYLCLLDLYFITVTSPPTWGEFEASSPCQYSKTHPKAGPLLPGLRITWIGGCPRPYDAGCCSWICSKFVGSLASRTQLASDLESALNQLPPTLTWSFKWEALLLQQSRNDIKTISDGVSHLVNCHGYWCFWGGKTQQKTVFMILTSGTLPLHYLRNALNVQWVFLG